MVDSACFKHQLNGGERFLILHWFMEDIYFELCTMEKMGNCVSSLPIKQVFLTKAEFNVLGTNASYMIDRLQVTINMGTLFVKQLSNETWIYATRNINLEGGDTVSVTIETTTPYGKTQRVDLSEEEFEDFVKILPDVDAEINVMMNFGFTHSD